MQKTKIINGLAEIADKYDFYIIDLWGVLHDGANPYPNALECLKFLNENNKRIILLSNAPRRAFKAEERLTELGFSKNLYDRVITSGEVTYNFVKNEVEGQKFFYIGPDKDADLFDDLGKTQVNKASEADFAVATGFEGFGSEFEEKKSQLDECLEAEITLFCANPDLKVVNQKGEEQICAGLMAKYYIEQGGKVEYFGKPFPKSYQTAKEILGFDDVSKVCCVGDSFHTDIEGGNKLGAATVLIAGGIYKNDLLDRNGDIAIQQIFELAENEHQIPDFIASEFKV